MNQMLPGHALMAVRTKLRADQRSLKRALQTGKPRGLIEVIEDRIQRGHDAMEWLAAVISECEENED